MPNTDGHDEPTLVRRFIAGDQSVLEDLLRTLVPPVRGALRRKYSGQLDYHEIQDIVIVGIRKLWSARVNYDPARASLETFFFKIAQNEAIDALRRKQWARVHVVPLGDRVDYALTSSPAHPNGEADGHPGSSRLLDDLDTCLKLLSEPERQILLADAHSRNEVADTRMLAEELGLSVNGVRVKRMRALGKLRKLLVSLGHSR